MRVFQAEKQLDQLSKGVSLLQGSVKEGSIYSVDRGEKAGRGGPSQRWHWSWSLRIRGLWKRERTSLLGDVADAKARGHELERGVVTAHGLSAWRRAAAGDVHCRSSPRERSKVHIRFLLAGGKADGDRLS